MDAAETQRRQPKSLCIFYNFNHTLGGRSRGVETNGLLSASSGSHRSGSPTLSIRSDRSTVTTIEKNSEFEDTKAKLKRRETKQIKVNIRSRWDCFMGLLFGPRKTEEKATVTVLEPEIDHDYGEV